MNKGWECPKCGKVFSPFIPECSYCNKEKYIQSPCVHEWDSGFDSTGGVPRCKRCGLIQGTTYIPRTTIT